MWALECLTGDYVFEFRLDPKTAMWKRREIVHRPKASGDGYDVLLRSTDDQLDCDDMFAGHAYTICNVKLVDRFQLVKLRNPWGTFEWSGAWSDKSQLWEQHPKESEWLS
ncbi:hypothetical protein GPECTOR_17g905 [Gonium pectorale]|uniref:Calpain catalytic domain-containing protein n=1 Tax=Gonium pectorale TaxID=33097 RepID=A0A150GKA0_GONPE|nr:hypothetical protein GPECTOR_17g905 [Gonium pectorale]|eukprot:KXZ50266.1 hypothetical protein GPECTOR_17g905 [Gonium pectorale]